MSVGELSYQAGTTEASLGRLQDSRAALIGEIRALEAAARRLSGGWTGDAQRAYDTAHTAWTASMSEMTAILDAAIALLQTWIDGMDEVETRLAAGWPG
jgi:WXG100 family type VII secretion target